MEQIWDKKRVIQLNNGDEPIVEQWLDAFVDILHTWLYYQVGADASIASDLTAETFERAIRELEQFEPDSVTMQQWLQEQAKAVLDHSLALRQMQPQRPWAWSHLPDNILCGLSQLRNEPLLDEAPNNPFVREMVQASLAEMEAPNRELMRQRYNQLQTPEQIANQTGRSIRDINDRLYRCRHFFRRVFVQLIQTANPDFSESSDTGSLELLDANLEKLLSATNMVQTVSPRDRAHIREFVLTAASQTPPLKSNGIDTKVVLGLSAAVAIVLLGLLGLLLWYTSLAPVPKPEPPVTQTPSSPPIPSTTARPVTPSEITEQIDEEELRRILELGQASDLVGLLEVLRNGQYTSQRTAAMFIGELGGEGAIGMLEEAEARWYPNGPADNPFAKAIMQIEDRLLAESETLIEEPVEPQIQEANEIAPVEPIEPEPEPPAQTTMITGTVMDLSGEPIANVQITLSENPLYGNSSNIQVLDQVTTDANGQYRFEDPPSGAFYLDCRSQLDGPAVWRAIWRDPETDCLFDFGGRPSVSGFLDGEPEAVSGQILCLSDTRNPVDATLRNESITSDKGRFSFLGVEPGSYYLLNATDMIRIVQLDTMEIERADLQVWNVELQQAEVVIEIEKDQTDPAVTDVVVTYGTEASEGMAQFPLLVQDDGTFYSDAIPLGSYTLIVQFENGMRLQQPLELSDDRTLSISVPQGSSLLSGTFTNPSLYTFFLSNGDQHVRFDLPAGEYMLEEIPPDRYTLSAVVNGLRLDFMEIDLLSEPEMILDIDAGELLADLSPLYVVVTDARGAMLSNAQVWVTGPGEVVTTESTGRGAFLALMPGEYSLYAALPGYSTAEQVIQVQPMPLDTTPNPDNTIGLQLKAP